MQIHAIIALINGLNGLLSHADFILQIVTSYLTAAERYLREGSMAIESRDERTTPIYIYNQLSQLLSTIHQHLDVTCVLILLKAAVLVATAIDSRDFYGLCDLLPLACIPAVMHDPQLV